jgi:hypothetical protein
VPWLLKLLVQTVGLPFVVTAASAPLLQKWFAASGHAASGDPYFLYSASNLGSLIALLGFPFLLEPLLTLAEQSVAWSAGFGLLLLLTACCAAVTWHSSPSSASPGNVAADPAPTVCRRLRWLMLSLAPSSLLLAVTTYVTTDLAAVPLFWVIPLALYLLSFILVFARREIVPHRWMLHALPVLALLAAFSLSRSTATPEGPLIVLHWLVLFAAAMVCHGELAKDRPAPRFLTSYYLYIALGGVLGGLFTTLAAPLLFQGTVMEYPLALVLACLLRPGPRLRDSSSGQRWLDLLLPGAVAVLCLGLVLERRRILHELPELPARIMLFGVPALVCWTMRKRPLRFAPAFAVLLLVFPATASEGGRVLYSQRNFFGLIRVHDDRDGRFRRLSHGSTLHGLQRLGSESQPQHSSEPLSYFHPSGPMGQVFELFAERRAVGLPPRVAVTGLGVGALASYARPSENWTYYEIDPDMVHAARRYFTFLDDCQADQLTIVTGDARLRLGETPEQTYGLLVLDAFSSDAVPVHLLTREALQLYNAKRAPGGLLVFNVTNRYLDLKPVLANLARDAGMVCFVRDDVRSPEEMNAGLFSSQWVIMADRVEDLGQLVRDPRWQRLSGQPGTRVWDDNFSNVLEVIRWR